MAGEFHRGVAGETLLRTKALSKSYSQRRRFSGRKFHISAFENVDFEIPFGQITALIGESGSGKSTLASCMALLEKPDSGEIWFASDEVSRWNRRQLASLRPRIQIVFQDSAGALNPTFTAAQIIQEPLEIQGRESGAGLRRRACELMEEVGLSSALENRKPLELSGGQRQRLAIARAIALKPSFLILDESLSSLDLSTQAQILKLLLELQAAHSLTYLLISHDLGLVGRIADFIAVMHQGRIVEHAPRHQILTNPEHVQTRKLLSTVRVFQSAFLAAHAGAGQ